MRVNLCLVYNCVIYYARFEDLHQNVKITVVFRALRLSRMSKCYKNSCIRAQSLVFVSMVVCFL